MNIGFIAGAVAGFTGIADNYIPGVAKTAIVGLAVAPIRLPGKLGSQAKMAAQGYVFGNLIRSITGGVTGTSANNSAGWV